MGRGVALSCYLPSLKPDGGRRGKILCSAGGAGGGVGGETIKMRPGRGPFILSRRENSLKP